MTLRARLREALAGDAPLLLPGDFAYDDETFPEGTPAAVLIAVVERDPPTLLLTRRDDGMRNHAGQVAFPGGRVDPEDDGPVAAALREAEEEVGLPRHAVEVIGAADTYRTGTGYAITPVVAIVPPDLPLVRQESEVAEIFEVPLAFVLDAANHAPMTLEHEGRVRHFYEIVWGERRIWGATAAMIVNLGRRLAHLPPAHG